MSADSLVDAERNSATSAADGWRRDRRFFTGMAAAAGLTVLAGFAPSYYLKGVFRAPALAPFFGGTELFVLACLLFDRITRGRVHPAFLWGGLLILVSQPLRLAIGGTQSWLAFAGWLLGGP